MKKRVDSLVAGDLITEVHGSTLATPAFVSGIRWDADHLNIVVNFMKPATAAVWSPHTEVVVIPHLLTRAQLHAEELLELARKLAKRWSTDAHDTSVIAEGKRLVELIDPPKVPSLVQVTDALDDLVDIIKSGAGGSIDPTELAKYQELVGRARGSAC